MRNLLSCKGGTMKFIILSLMILIGAFGMCVSERIMDSEYYYLNKFAEVLDIDSAFIFCISIIFFLVRFVSVCFPIIIPAIFKFLDYILC